MVIFDAHNNASNGTISLVSGGSPAQTKPAHF